MPSKLFGIVGRRQAPQTDGGALANKPANITSQNNISPETQIPSRRASMDHITRPSLLNLGKKHGSNDKKNKSKERSMSKDLRSARRDSSQTIVENKKPVKLDLIFESPPALFLDAPQQSSGALISGRLQVTPRSEDVTLDSIIMYLECTTTTKRPVEARCRECMSNVSDLYEWKFLSKPKTFDVLRGTQELPFSHLIPGHIPATIHGHIGTIDYSLHVRAKTNSGQEIELRRDLDIRRALRPGNDKNSVRIFPPTNLTLHVTLPSIVHPIGDFNVQCRMTGVTNKRDDTQTRWRLRKLTWRIEEKETMISPACAKHAHKVGGEGKGVQHEHTRDVGMEELKAGWKTDFESGEIEGEFVGHFDTSMKPQCDVEAPNGLKILHNLIVELVIAEEWAPNKKPSQATPTGAARVLRTQFGLNVTERAGMGISWDDEMPPMYEDVPASPPHYQNDHTSIFEYTGDDLHEDIEQLNLSDGTAEAGRAPPYTPGDTVQAGRAPPPAWSARDIQDI